MRKEKTQKGNYETCVSEGLYINASENIEIIPSMIALANSDYQTAKEIAKESSPDGYRWNAIYKLHYDVLHNFSEVLLLLDGIKARTHECLFTYVCEKHPELELSLDFFEKVRIKRNHSLYYGKRITYNDWKEVELQLNLYISTLKKAIEQKLSQNK